MALTLQVGLYTCLSLAEEREPSTLYGCISGPHLMRGPCPRSGRRLVVETVVPRCLAGLHGPTAELGGL